MKTSCLFLFILLCLGTHAQQPAVQPLRNKVTVLYRFLDQKHYQPLKWNDSSSILLYNRWMNKLDDNKLLFTQPEISILEQYKTKLDDEITGRGALEFFNRCAALYQAALQRADSLLKIALLKPVDLSRPDNITWPFTTYASSTADYAQRWQRFLKWRVLERIADKLSADGKTISETLPADFAQLEKDSRERTRKQEAAYISSLLKTPANFKTGLENNYLDAIAWCYDPHTNYMSMQDKQEFDTEMSASEFSAGFEWEENEKGDLAISFLQPGGSAWRSGQLHKGDVLVKIKAAGVEQVVADMEEDALEQMLGGNSKTEFELTVRTAAGEIKTVKLSTEKTDDEESVVKSYVLHGNKNIGYISLPGFYSRENESASAQKDLQYDGCANDVSKEIVKLKKDTIAGLILDLRYNGGGSMWEAMQLAGIFIDIGPVASVKGRDGKVSFLKDPNRGTIYDGPLMVLINGASASASEFVSAVLQDYNRALIAGGTSYGKGTAQIVLPMDTLPVSPGKQYQDFVKVTEQKFYRVNGSTTQWKGVIPDIVLPDVYADEQFREKANASALLPDNSKTGIYQPLPPLPVQAIKSKSEQRVAGSDYFKAISHFSNWLREYRAGRSIPLQWNSYALHYKKSLEIFKGLDKNNNTNVVFTAGNNSFDRQRVNASTSHSQDNNRVYLKEVQEDVTLAEACQVMMDWINK